MATGERGNNGNHNQKNNLRVHNIEISGSQAGEG